MSCNDLEQSILVLQFGEMVILGGVILLVVIEFLKRGQQ